MLDSDRLRRLIMMMVADGSLDADAGMALIRRAREVEPATAETHPAEPAALSREDERRLIFAREDQLSIVIDGRVFTDETKVTMYSNAMELARFAPPGLIDAMKKQPISVVARLGSGLGGFDFSDGGGGATANAVAAANCN